jgi:hypothetical protein
MRYRRLDHTAGTDHSQLVCAPPRHHLAGSYKAPMRPSAAIESASSTMALGIGCPSAESRGTSGDPRDLDRQRVDRAGFTAAVGSRVFEGAADDREPPGEIGRLVGVPVAPDLVVAPGDRERLICSAAQLAAVPTQRVPSQTLSSAPTASNDRRVIETIFASSP